MIRTERLRALRQAKGLSASKAAKMMNMSQAQLLNYENGKTDPSTHALMRMVRFYETSADFLLGVSPSPKSHKRSGWTEE